MTTSGSFRVTIDIRLPAKLQTGRLLTDFVTFGLLLTVLAAGRELAMLRKSKAQSEYPGLAKKGSH